MQTPRLLVVDRNEALADQIRTVADDLRPRPEVVSCSRVGALGEALTEDGSVRPTRRRSQPLVSIGLGRLELIRDEMPDLTMLLAFSRRPDAALRSIVRTGAIDMVQLPVADDDLRDALSRAMEIAVRRTPTHA